MRLRTTKLGRFRLIVGLAAIFAGLGGGPARSRANPEPNGATSAWQLVDDFDDVQPSWRIQRHESLRQVISQRRTDNRSHRGLRCEYFAIQAGKGDGKIFASHAVPACMAIGELGASVWICGNRPGFRLLARVRLPRTLDEKTGEPLSVIVQGDEQYRSVGDWQRLTLFGVEEKLADKTRVLRAKLGPHVDSAEAYVDLLILNIYGEAGLNRIWVDDLMLTGVVPARNLIPKSHGVRYASYQSGVGPAPVQLKNGRLTLQQRPWLARVIRWQGETFGALHQLGFNCVWLSEPATVLQDADARKNDLWLICPPPNGDVDLAALDRVIAWQVADETSDVGTPTAQAIARGVRARDRLARPLLAATGGHHDGEPEFVSVVNDIAEVGVAHQRSPGVRWSWLSLHPEKADLTWNHVRGRAYEAVAAGCSGLVVSTDGNLEHAARRRQRQLSELLHLELAVLEPWVLARQVDVTSQGNSRVFLLSHGPATMVLIHSDVKAAKSPKAASNSSLVIPTTRTSDAFLVEADGLSPVPHQHVAGGIRVTLPPSLRTARILLCDQPAVIRHLMQRQRETGPRANELLSGIARAELLELDRLISKYGGSQSQQALLRNNLHRVHGAFPDSASQSAVTTSRQLEAVLFDLDSMRQLLAP